MAGYTNTKDSHPEEEASTAINTDDLLTIPQPPEHLFGMLGNLPDIDRKRMTLSLLKLADIYGPIFKLNVLSQNVIVVSSQALTSEICDESRFGKFLSIPKEVRWAFGDGMITANTHEHVSLSP